MSVPHRFRQALADQLAGSLHGPLPRYTPRQLQGRLLVPGKATAVIGARRAGKTTFLHQARVELTAEHGSLAAAPYVSFEDERLIGLDAQALGAIVEEYRRLLPPDPPATARVWCFDEIQLVAGWERFVRRLLDEGQAQVLVSGSSATLLSREIASSLRGRAWQVVMHPFSFAEACRHRGVPLPERPRFATSEERRGIEEAFSEWLRTGGFPEAQGLDTASRHQLLRDYVDVAILRDVVERHRVGNVTGLRWLTRHLLGNAGGLFSVERFHAALRSQGIAIAKDTVHRLLAHLEDCFLIRLVSMESNSERQRMVNPRKAYPVDPGMIPVYDRTGRANLGHALETAVCIELERRRLDVTYVRTPRGYEVDFLARAADRPPELIQVCADLSDPDTAEREFRALADAARVWPDATRRVLTLADRDAPVRIPENVIVQPAHEWMLD